MSETVYARAEYESVDIGALMREGHPYIREGDERIVEIASEFQRDKQRAITILDIGSGSGVLSAMMAAQIPGATVVANEIEPSLIRMARQRALRSRFSVYERPFEEWLQPVDIVISWGSHHHLQNSYLQHVRDVLQPDGLFIFGDEFCPEYCTPADALRIANADAIFVAGGFVLTTPMEKARYEADGDIPEWSRDLEEKRQRALWSWYKYVIDYAFQSRCPTVAIAELGIARDDLITAFSGEHKLSPLIVERDLFVAGFKVLREHCLERSRADLQSFFIYELESAA